MPIGKTRTAVEKFDHALQILRAEFVAQYERSEAILAQISNITNVGKRQRATRKDQGVPRKARAPKGTATALVQRVLAKGQHTVKEIMEAGSSDAEKLVSDASVRLELQRGQSKKQYVNRDGKWSLRKGAA